MRKKCLVLGAGPAGLLAAKVLSDAGHAVELYDKCSGPGRKLLIAGSSGLNVAFEASQEDFSSFYRARAKELAVCFQKFGKQEWLDFIDSLGITHFLGTSKRYFVEGMKASPFLRAWVQSLEKNGVQFFYKKEFTNLQKNSTGDFLVSFSDGSTAQADSVLFSLGGGSYEKEYPSWVNIFRGLGIAVNDLHSANAGFHLDAPLDFFTFAEGKPVKGVRLITSRGEKLGELMITRYGLEGTPIYAVGAVGLATLDLKPDMAEGILQKRLDEAPGQVWRKIERAARLSPGALALLQFFAPKNSWDSTASAAKVIKSLPITLTKARPLEEAISSSGGISWDELSADLESKKIHGLFFAGEMVDWDAPTGGFLLTACAATGHAAASGMLRFLSAGN